MLIDEIRSNDLNVFIASGHDELTYKSVMSYYLAMHRNQHTYPTYLLDIECDTTNLISPPCNINVNDLEQLDIDNPNKTFIVLCSPLSKEKILLLRQKFHLPSTLTEQDIKALEFKHSNNAVYNSIDVYNKRFRVNGTGARVFIIDMVENVFELGNKFDSVQELASYDFAGFLVRGVANTSIFKTLTARTNIAVKPILSIQGTNILDVKAEPKKLTVCYSATMIRFMAIENVKYFFKMLDPELFEQIHFQNLAEMDIHSTVQYLTKSFAFICLDMAQEYPILMAEAMLSGNIVMGFSGTFDAESDLNNTITDFSPECDYRDIANKLVAYARDYYQNLQNDPNYLHPIAKRGIEHAKANYGLAGQISVFEQLLSKLGVI